MPGADRGPIDKNKFVEGTITVSEEMKSKIVPTSVLFVTIHSYDAEAAAPVGKVIAVLKLAEVSFPARFKLTERHVMGERKLSGQVLITAWTDQDHEVATKQIGDLVGEVPVAVPAAGVVIKLDRVQKEPARRGVSGH